MGKWILRDLFSSETTLRLHSVLCILNDVDTGNASRHLVRFDENMIEIGIPEHCDYQTRKYLRKNQNSSVLISKTMVPRTCDQPTGARTGTGFKGSREPIGYVPGDTAQWR